MNTLEKINMENQNLKLKEAYNKYVSDLSNYHSRVSKYNGPEEMLFQLENRSNIISNVSDLCGELANNSHYILEAFDKYKDYLHKSGVNIDLGFFTDITKLFMYFLSEREEINRWCYQLLDDVDYLKANKVDEMSAEEINNL